MHLGVAVAFIRLEKVFARTALHVAAGLWTDLSICCLAATAMVCRASGPEDIKSHYVRRDGTIPVSQLSYSACLRLNFRLRVASDPRALFMPEATGSVEKLFLGRRIAGSRQIHMLLRK